MKLTEAIVIPKMGSSSPMSPLKDSDTIRVYHATSEAEVVYTALKRGISGGSHVVRKYSYEQNNNPRGLFVTPDLKTAKEFGDYVLEFHTRVHNLESPVWPGGTFTVPGQMSGIFSDSQERELERLKKREQWSQSEYEYVRNSDRPELAAILLHAGERQALFTGDLNPNSIRAIWISDNPTRTGQQYSRMSPSEFIKMYEAKQVPSRFGSMHGGNEVSSEAKKRIIKPQDDVSGEEFVDILMRELKIKLSRDHVIRVLKQDPGNYIQDRVWNDRQYRRIYNDILRM